LIAKILLTRAANSVLTLSAWLVTALGAALLFVLTPLYDWASRVAVLQNLLLGLGGALLLFALPAALLLLFGMLLFCLLRDPAPASRRFVWIFFFFTTACFGAAVYFFRVYRPERKIMTGEGMLVHMERLVPDVRELDA
jgi:hypothetical protein